MLTECPSAMSNLVVTDSMCCIIMLTVGKYLSAMSDLFVTDKMGHIILVTGCEYSK